MTITLLGDSLSAGNLGVPYSRYLHREDNEVIISEGLDGDTVTGVLNRVDEILRKTVPETLVLEIGANDILLPVMEGRGRQWQAFLTEMYDRGSVPCRDSRGFGEKYGETIGRILDWGVNQVVCVTIPVLGEEPLPGTEERRRVLNGLIHEIAESFEMVVADSAAAFDRVLEGVEQRSDWFFSRPEEFITDLRRIRRDRSAMPLSEERGLYLTMDGAHLNETGAELMGRTISDAVDRSHAVPQDRTK